MPQNPLLQEKAWLDSVRRAAIQTFAHDFRAPVVESPLNLQPGRKLTFGNCFDPEIQTNLTLGARSGAAYVFWGQYTSAIHVMSIAAASFNGRQTIRTAYIGLSGSPPAAIILVGRKWRPANEGSVAEASTAST